MCPCGAATATRSAPTADHPTALTHNTPPPTRPGVAPALTAPAPSAPGASQRGHSSTDAARVVTASPASARQGGVHTNAGGDFRSSLRGRGAVECQHDRTRERTQTYQIQYIYIIIRTRRHIDIPPGERDAKSGVDARLAAVGHRNACPRGAVKNARPLLHSSRPPQRHTLQTSQSKSQNREKSINQAVSH